MQSIERFFQASLEKQLTGLFLVSALLFGFISWAFSGYFCDFYKFYDGRVRGFLFSGFISVGSFLLSLMTFVVVTLKDRLFDSEFYAKVYRNQNSMEDDEKIFKNKLYAPLKRLTWFLHLSIIFSFFTALAQFSIGLYKSSYTALFCVYLGFFTAVLLLNCLRLIKANILVWLDSDQEHHH